MSKKKVQEVVAAVVTPVVYRYKSDGSEFHSGIPARDLTAGDVAQLDEERQLVLSVSPLYEAVAPETAGKEGV